MIRLVLLTAFVGGLAAYAFKDWYKSLCGLILLMAVVEHPDMPKTIFGIQGLNPWNILLLFVVLAWALNRHREELDWDMPGIVTAALLAYLAVMSIGLARMLADLDSLRYYAAAMGEDPPTAVQSDQ